MWYRAALLALTLATAGCGSREADAPKTEEEAAAEFEAALKGAGTPGSAARAPAETSPASAEGSDGKPFVTECAIDWQGRRYVERCRYFPQAGGSFAITKEAGGTLVPGAASIGVFVRPDGYAVISATDPSGRAVRWGIAQRAPQNDDCWEGDGFWVCAG